MDGECAAVPVACKDPKTGPDRSWDGPRLEPAGECVVCRGGLEPDLDLLRVGINGRWYCQRCGLCYHHLPSRPPGRVVPLRGLADDDICH